MQVFCDYELALLFWMVCFTGRQTFIVQFIYFFSGMNFMLAIDSGESGIETGCCMCYIKEKIKSDTKCVSECQST